MTDKDLVGKIRNGDHDSFKVMIENHQRLIINTCKGFLHNDEDAHDVAQDVFIEAYRSIKKFRGDSKISTWLYRIAVNRSLNFIRDNRKHKQVNDIDLMYSKGEKHPEIESNPLLPDTELENRERSVVLFNAIDELPKKQKTAFILNKYENLSYKEISEIMNRSITAVESLLFRAKKNLQKKLLNYYKENL
jgi:RNA polymerase sigma-70 factor (ECF subfamily)